MRTDNPGSNPRMKVDAVPDRGRRVYEGWTPKPAAPKADNAPKRTSTKPAPVTKRRTALDDARDRVEAKRDEAIATIGQAWRNPRKPAQAKAPGDKLKPDARQAAHDAIKGAYRRSHK